MDIAPQPRYPFEFVQADALGIWLGDLGPFAAVHASPPCQAYSALAALHPEREHPRLIEPTRARLRTLGVPYVIENVPGAPLESPVRLCGTMFGLGFEAAELRRHRLFEIQPAGDLALLPPCSHGARAQTVGVYGGGGADPRPGHRGKRAARTVAVYGHTGGYSKRVAARWRGSPQQFPIAARRLAMGIDWMSNAELCEAIPPAYTEWIGRQLLAVIA